MTTIALHQPPALGPVVRQQLRAVRSAATGPAAGLALILVLFIAIVSAWSARVAFVEPLKFGSTLDPFETLPVCLMGMFMAAVVWQREEPSRRGYHLAMPVPSTEHTLMRVWAGWVWLMVGVAGYLAWLCALGGLIALIGGGPFTSHFSTWHWFAPFAGATMAYLLTSIPVVASDRPLFWIVTPPMFIVAMLVLPSIYGARVAERHVVELLNSPFSPAAPLYPVFYTVPAATHSAVLGHPVINQVVLDWQKGVVATLLWTAIGIGGVWLAARRKAPATK